MTDSSVITKREHFIALEWLRFLLGVYIVFFHTFHYDKFPSWVNKITELGFFSTSTFFVLSGFLLAHIYLKNHNTENVCMSESAKTFLAKRFSNLYPIHIGSLLITLLIVSSLPFLNINDGDLEASIRFVVYDVNNHTPYDQLKHWMDNTELSIAFFMNAFMLQAWNPYYLTFNAPAWSVSTLFFLYLLFPYISVKLDKIKKPLLAIMIVNLIYLIPVLIVALYSNYGMPETGILHRNPIIRLPEFICGILLCSFFHKRKSKYGSKPLSKSHIFWLVLLIISSLLLASYLLYIAQYVTKKGNISYYFLHNGLLLPAQLSLIYLCLFIKAPKNKKILNISMKLGACSLSMFALHVPIYLVYSRIQKVLSGEPTLCFTDLTSCIALVGDKNMWYYPIYIIITVLICVLFQEHFVSKIRSKIENKLLRKNVVIK